MKRRNRYEIQVETDVPSYIHTSKSECIADESSSSDDGTVDILYNNIYKIYGTDGQYAVSAENYDRDNYCVVPLTVPSLSLNQSTPFIPKDITKPVTRVSTWMDIEYDYNILINKDQDKNLNLVGMVGSELTYILNNLNACTCSDGPTHENTYPELTPLDSINTFISDVSDEYAYSWDQNWDMTTINTISRPRVKKQQSSSSDIIESTLIAPVYLGTVSASPGGAGGIIIVHIDAQGNTQGANGGYIAVNFPKI